MLKRSDAERQKLIARQANNGLSLLLFCPQQEFSSKTFYKQSRALQQKAADHSTEPFIKIKPKLTGYSHTDDGFITSLSECQVAIICRRGCDLGSGLDAGTGMKLLAEVSEIYLHRDTADFCKSINCLVLIIEQQINLSPLPMRCSCSVTLETSVGREKDA